MTSETLLLLTWNSWPRIRTVRTFRMGEEKQSRLQCFLHPDESVAQTWGPLTLSLCDHQCVHSDFTNKCSVGLYKQWPVYRNTYIFLTRMNAEITDSFVFLLQMSVSHQDLSQNLSPVQDLRSAVPVCIILCCEYYLSLFELVIICVTQDLTLLV